MRWNRNTAVAASLIAIGVLLLLNWLGIDVFGWIVPLALIGLGWYGITVGKRTIGWIVLIIGLIGILGKVWAIAAIVVPIALIWIGWSLLKQRNSY